MKITSKFLLPTAVTCAVGHLVFGRLLETNPVKVFFWTGVCLVVGQVLHFSHKTATAEREERLLREEQWEAHSALGADIAILQQQQEAGDEDILASVAALEASLAVMEMPFAWSTILVVLVAAIAVALGYGAL